MSPSPKSTAQRIQDAVVRALGMRGPAPAIPLAMGSIPGWDSMGHMNVVLAIEREFGVRFEPYRLPELVDVASIAKTLKAYGIGD